MSCCMLEIGLALEICNMLKALSSFSANKNTQRSSSFLEIMKNVFFSSPHFRWFISVWNVALLSQIHQKTGSKQLKSQLERHCTFLEDAIEDVFGIQVFGSGWKGNCTSRPIFAMGKEVDILLTHGPIHSHCSLERCDFLLKSLIHFKELQRVSVHLFGHIHEDYSPAILKYSSVPTRTLVEDKNAMLQLFSINAANANFNKPIVFDLLASNATQ